MIRMGLVEDAGLDHIFAFQRSERRDAKIGLKGGEIWLNKIPSGIGAIIISKSKQINYSGHKPTGKKASREK
jgi:hypothetical protein